MSHCELALACNLVLHHCPARFNGLEFGVVGRCAYNLVPLCTRKFIKRIGWGWGSFLENFHIPSDLVVDSCPHMLRAAQPLIPRGYTTRGRKTSHKIKPTISRGCDFTTKSGGVWDFLIHHGNALPAGG